MQQQKNHSSATKFSLTLLSFAIPCFLLFPLPTAAELPLGRVRLADEGAVPCEADLSLPGAECWEASVQCGDFRLQAQLRILEPATAEQGTVAMLGGGAGNSYWGDKSTVALDALAELSQAGYRTVEIQWFGQWSVHQDGPGAGACRTATLLDALQARWPGRWLLSGNSGGAMQAAFSVAWYGITFDKMVLSGGPVHQLTWICLGIDGHKFASDRMRTLIDKGFGFGQWQGPCYFVDPAWQVAFETASLLGYEGARLTYSWPVSILIGDQDTGASREQGLIYHDLLQDAGTAVDYTIVPNTPHPVHATLDGVDAILDSLLRLD